MPETFIYDIFTPFSGQLSGGNEIAQIQTYTTFTLRITITRTTNLVSPVITWLIYNEGNIKSNATDD